ncbi:MAG: GrpB family protein [Micropruina sp.]|uniref:GrpB family protein n=1 Tax=Micropruina sp. TaxID=2737536 RepID=UPI0039E244D0
MRINVDEPVTVGEYDPAWPDRFAVERQRIVGAFANAKVEHIGSTAVPGLDAKPVIDILVGLTSHVPDRVTTAALSDLGYEPLGEAGVPGRLYFRHRSPSQSFNVHVVAHGGRLWCDNLALRDYLRRHPLEAAEYARVKRHAAEEAAVSLIRYSELKARTVESLLGRARAEVAAEG